MNSITTPFYSMTISRFSSPLVASVRFRLSRRSPLTSRRAWRVRLQQWRTSSPRLSLLPSASRSSGLCGAFAFSASPLCEPRLWTLRVQVPPPCVFRVYVPPPCVFRVCVPPSWDSFNIKQLKELLRVAADTPAESPLSDTPGTARLPRHQGEWLRHPRLKHSLSR